MSKIYDPNTKFNKIYMFIGNTVTIITAILSIILWLVKKVTQNLNSLPPIFSQVLSYILHFCIITFIIAIILLLSRLIYAAIKSKAEAFYIQRKLTEFFHRELIHQIRNNIVELESLSNKVNKFSSQENIEAISECYNNELEVLKQNVKSYIDSMSDYLGKYRNSTISVCIKIFKKRNRNRVEFQAEEIITLARSSNTEKDRSTNEKTFVGQNTDFTNLCDGKIIFFASSNLHKIKESGLYINDSVNWEQKYTSTLVTPIRYHNNESQHIQNKNIKSDIIGFLCIDSQEEIKEWESPDSFELQFMAMFSDILYVYIKEFYRCFENTRLKL